MGIRGSKLLRRKGRRAIAAAPILDTHCAYCKKALRHEVTNFCDTCATKESKNGGAAWSDHIYCEECKHGHVEHCQEHVILPLSDPLAKCDLKLLKKQGNTVDDLDSDVVEAFSELKEQMTRAEKSQRALESTRALISKYEWMIRDSRPMAVLSKEAKTKLEQKVESAKFRTRLLALEETFETVMASNCIDLVYYTGDPRDSLLNEIRRQYHSSNLNAASEGLFELVDASGGRVTLSEMYMISEVVMEKMETLRRFYDKMMDDRAAIEAREEGRLVSTMMTNVVEDLRHECSSMFNLLSGIHGHADHFDDSEIPSKPPMTTIQYLLALRPEKDEAPKLVNKPQKFHSVQIKLVRHFVASAVSALWLHMTPADSHDFGEVADQLRSSWKGYLTAAGDAGWGEAHPVRVLLIALLLELGLNSLNVANFKSMKKAIEKMLERARRAGGEGLSKGERHMSGECMVLVEKAFKDLFPRPLREFSLELDFNDNELKKVEDSNKENSKIRFDITGTQEQRELDCNIRCHYDFLSGVLTQSQKN